VEVRDVEESKALNGRRGPAIIVSASGMATGGRVVHHLSHRLPDAANTIVLVGFQAEGTRGLWPTAPGSSSSSGGTCRFAPTSWTFPAFSVHADRAELMA
jgi:metallo-beta-lactamase family protein